MYAPSPISGWLADRVGRITVVAFANAVMIIGCITAAAADPADDTAITLALLLLGLGWNGNFVAGSALVTESVASHERPRVQSVTDTCTFLASGMAALVGGFVLQWSSYTVMGVATAAMAGLCTVIVVAYNQATRAVLTPRP
jgi:MFS family permease